MPPKYGQGGVVPKHFLGHCEGRGWKEGAGNRGREREKVRGRRREERQKERVKGRRKISESER
jgi:hypothetical protein